MYKSWQVSNIYVETPNKQWLEKNRKKKKTQLWASDANDSTL